MPQNPLEKSALAPELRFSLVVQKPNWQQIESKGNHAQFD